MPDSENQATATEPFDFRSLVADDGGFVEDWTDRLPDDLRQDLGESKALANIKNPQQLLKTTIGNSKLAGRALLPGKDAKPEDWLKVLEAMPKPKDGEGYGLNADGITDEALKKFNEKTGYMEKLERVLARAGVPHAIAARIAEADAVEKSEMLRAANEEATAMKAALVERYGGEQQYESNRLAGRDALARLYGDQGKGEFDDMVAMLDAYQIADHPMIVNMLTRMAQRMSPGKIAAGGHGGPAPVKSGIASILPNTSKAMGIS